MKQLLRVSFAIMAFCFSFFVSRAEEHPEGIYLEPFDGMVIELRIDNDYMQSVDREFLINSFAMNNAKKFTQSDLVRIKSLLPELTDSQLQMIMSADYKDPNTMLIISILLGGLGVDRFMLGQTGLGVAKLLTGGGLGIWWLIDLFSIQEKTKEYNGKLFDETLQNSQLLLTVPR